MKPENPELFALEFGKIAETDFVYTLASPNINQTAPNLVKMYVTIRYRMSSIMDWIGADLSELFALEFVKIAESDFVCTLASTNVDQWVIYRPVSTKLGQNIYVQQNLNEFDHGSNWTKTSGVIWSWIVKNCCIRLYLLCNVYKYKPISTKLGHNEYEHKISDEFDYGSSHTRSVGVLSPWNRKIELQ